MKIAELFVELTMKGAGNAAKEISGIGNSLKGIKETSLETKAAILGIIYGLDRMTSTTGQFAASLDTLSLTTGESAQMIQNWQNAARTFGVEGREVESTIGAIHQKMQDLRHGQGTPTGLNMLTSQFKIEFDQTKAWKDAGYVMLKMQELAKSKLGDNASKSGIMASFGVTPEMQKVLYKNTLDMTKKHGLILSNGQIDQRERTLGAMMNIKKRLSDIGSEATDKFAIPAANEILYAVKAFEKLSTAVSKSQTAMIAIAGLFGAIAISTAPLTAAIASLTFLLAEFQKRDEGKDSIFGADKKGDSTLSKIAKSIVGENGLTGTSMKFLADLTTGGVGFNKPKTWEDVKAANITQINNTNIHGVPDAKSVGNEVTKAHSKAHKTLKTSQSH